MSSEILKKLEGGDPRAMGQVYLVVEEVEANAALLAELFVGAVSPNPLLRQRAAIVITRVGQNHPEYLDPFRMRLFDVLEKANQRMYRRDLIALFPHLNFTEDEQQRVSQVLHSYLNDKTVTVVISAMKALVALAGDDLQKQVKLLPMLEDLIRNGMPYTRMIARRVQEKLYQSLIAEE